MRKSKILLAATMCCTMLLAVGCGKKENTKDYSKYVELGEYKNIEVTLESTDVTKDEVTKEINTRLQNASTKKEVKDRKVVDGDVVNIDYVGKVDGKEFDGGSAEGYNLTIGSKTFVDNFEEQLIGSKPGDVVEVKVTFPKDYKEESLANKEATFTVTVNHIVETVVPKLTDKWVAKTTSDEIKTVKEYKTSVEAELKKEKEEAAATKKTADVLTKIVDNSKINGYPQDEIDAYVNNMRSMYEQYAAMMQIDFETYLGYMDMTEEDFSKEMKTLAEATIARQMVCKLIAKAEGMTVSDEEYKTGLEDYVKQYSNDSVTYTAESFEEQYGKDVITENILLEKVLDFITENAVEV